MCPDGQWYQCVSLVQLVSSALSLFVWIRYSLEGHYSCPNPALPYPPSLLQGSCTPLMVATLHPPSAGIAPQYSLPLGLSTGVGQPTLLEHTATVLVKQRWYPWRKTCTCALPVPLTMPSFSCPLSLFFFMCLQHSLSSVPHVLWGLSLYYTSYFLIFPFSHPDL